MSYESFKVGKFFLYLFLFQQLFHRLSKQLYPVLFSFADPNIMKKLQVDRGAIKFVLAGANIMCPGLTSPGGALDDAVSEETPVVLL